MNKIFKNALVALVALTGLTMTSCVNKYEYSGAADEGSKVFFSKDLASTVDVSFDDNKFQVAVSRTSTAGELTVPVTVTMGEESIFTPAANSVSFADGEATAYLTFNYDPANVEYGKYDDIKVEISDASLATTYGLSAYAFKAGKTEWKLMDTSNGKASYRDDIMSGLMSIDNETWNVTIYESVATPGRYMIEDPYGLDSYRRSKLWSNEDEIEEYYALATDKTPNIVINAQDPNFVYTEEFELPYSSIFGFNMTIISWVQYYLDNGTSLETLKKARPQYFGKVEDNVISMPASQILWTKDGELWNYANTNGLFAVALPGAVIGDFSLEATYSGIFTNPEGNVFAVTEVKLGDDASNTKAVVMSAEVDPSAVADAIAGGDLEGIDVIDGSNNVPIPEDLSGKLQVIFVVMNGANVKTVVSVPFEYYRGDGNPWQSLGKATYYEDFIGSVFSIGVLNYEVEIEENSQEPGMYRLINPYENYPANEEGDFTPGSSFNIDINATDPEGVYILKQPIGMDWGYGDMYIQTQGAYYLENGNSYDTVKSYGWFGTLKDKVITFPYGTRDASDGTKVPYGGWLWMGDSRYYGGANQSIAIVLPGANLSSAARRALERNLNANNFERRLNMVPSQKVSKKDYLKSSILLKRQ